MSVDPSGSHVWVCRDGVDFVDDAFLFAAYSPPQQLINRYNEVCRSVSFTIIACYNYTVANAPHTQL